MEFALNRRITYLVVFLLTFSQLTTIQATPVLAKTKPIFYMYAEPGCYSSNLRSNPTIPMYSIKKLYPVSCFEPHHFEVFWVGQIKPKKESKGIGGKEAVNECLQKSKELGYYKRNANFYNWSAGEELLIGNWMADIGTESQRFPNKTICYTSLTTKSWIYIKEVNYPLIRGFEKYES